MREILFRGIPKREADFHFFKIAYQMSCEGNFVIGSLLYEALTNRYYIVNAILAKINCTVGNAQCTAVEVDPATVGQYTGLKDKNGKRIFEGDIVRTDFDGAMAVIAFGDYASPFNSDEFTHNIGFYPAWEKKFITRLRKDLGFFCTATGDIEVIGNIHDNPELLKGKGKESV